MFGIFKKKKKKKTAPQILDINGNPLQVGDIVKSHRYDLGLAEISLEGFEYFYTSKETRQKVSYTKMVDAITGHQKVEKTD